jgi:hypothetical protein
MPLLRRRRPLLRAAAVGGGAYFAGKRHQENQQREAEQDERLDAAESQPAPAPSAGGMSTESISQLKELGQLHEQGVLTDQEFDQQKAKVLAG